MKIRYRILASKIFEKGLKKKAVAESIGITPRALNNKLYGITPFTWGEVCKIQQIYFPDIIKDDLFATDEDKKTA